MLRLEAMSCGYGGMRAVEALDLEVGAGEIVALVGANGAGKSSTLMAIAGHVELQGGRILFDGDDISSAAPMARVASGIALAPEGRRLFRDLSVRENLVVGGYVRDAGRQARNIETVLALFPRLAERFERPAGTLSGGEQQMVAIGRALMSEPRLMLIDEVSLGLMPKMVDVCYGAIRALRARGLGVLLVEQSTERAFAAADRVCVLESGRAVWRGSAAEARGNSAVIDAYLGVGRATADAAS
ncbi:MAG: ABC transporter ATP-binding protein [Alphaproteobacteria bacterium]|nr:ABC transporter ATP-binding protein [Alphaproteobacteria bacterium]